jgi:hypothetical protein
VREQEIVNTTMCAHCTEGDPEKAGQRGRERDVASRASHGNECVDKASKSNLPFLVRCAVLLSCLVSTAVCAASPFDLEWTRRVELTGLTHFVRHGVERAEGSLQPGAWLVSETLELGTWTNFPLNDTRSHELALVGRYTVKFDTGAALAFELTHFHLRDARNGHPGHTAELGASFAQPAGPGRLVVGYLRDVKREADVVQLAYEGEWALKSWGGFLNYRAHVGTKAGRDVLPNLPGPAVADSYTFFGADLTLPYRIGGQTILTAGVHYAGTVGQRRLWSPVAASPGGRAWATLAATYEF